MKRFFNGENYNFQITANFQYKTFEILAKHLKSSKVSSITNTNVILSQYDEIISQKDFVEETEWKLKDNATLQLLISKSLTWFENISFVHYIEKELDKDMVEGGWNSTYVF